MWEKIDPLLPCYGHIYNIRTKTMASNTSLKKRKSPGESKHVRLAEVQTKRIDELRARVSSDVYDTCFSNATSIIDNRYHLSDQMTKLDKERESIPPTERKLYYSRKLIIANKRRKLIREQLLRELEQVTGHVRKPSQSTD